MIVYLNPHTNQKPVFELSLFDTIDEDTIIADNSDLISTAKILIYGGEGTSIPHFHYIDRNHKIDTCIMLDDNRYFSHGVHKGVISDSKTRKLLNKILEGKCINTQELEDNKPNVFGTMVWSAMVIYYNYFNGTNIDSDPTKKKNYSTIKPYK